MLNKQFGFSAIETVIVLAVLIAVGASGYKVYESHHKTSATTTAHGAQAVNATSSAPAGTTTAIDNLLAQQSDQESTLDQQQAASDQSAATGPNSATASLGGAYNESSF